MMSDEMIEEADLSPAAKSYLRRLKPQERADAREWAVEDSEVFKMRIGTAVDEIAKSVKTSKVSPHILQALYTSGAIVAAVYAGLTGRI